jgi:phosphoribosylaminoimidazole-succinocarboxamide synthase
MKRTEKLYEGKAKVMYATEDPDFVIQYFKDDATAFDAQKRGTIVNKGVLNNAISTILFALLEEHGIATHFVERMSDREMLVKRLEIVPVEVVMRNVVAGSLAKRMGMEEGGSLGEPILEYYYKKDELHDPMVNDYHIMAFGWATADELAMIRDTAFRVNDLLKGFLLERSIRLVDFKLEFGKHHGTMLLGDEISPDGCRLWDAATNEKLDKDRFRRDLGKIEEAYQEVHRRICS